MIPRVIHYCWFGGKEKSRLAKKCITSWKKFCPDYEIVEWNEGNFDVHMNPYTEYCYKNGKWAFLSDYARLFVVSQYGGIYFDTDVEVIRSFDDLLETQAFFCFESNDYVATGLGFGAVPGHETISAMLIEYENLIDDEKNVKMISCPQLNTIALSKMGLILNGEYQIVNDARILPVDWLNPYEDNTGILRITNNTHSIHWYSKSALNRIAILRSRITRPFHRIFGINCFYRVKKILNK